MFCCLTMAKSKATKPVYTRWGAPHRTYTSKKFELYRNDPTKGFTYNAQELISDYLRNLWSTDRLFNDCNPKTFNANFRGWPFSQLYLTFGDTIWESFSEDFLFVAGNHHVFSLCFQGFVFVQFFVSFWTGGNSENH